MRNIKELTSRKKSTGGRNNRGRITVRHRGGGHRRLLRHIDYKRQLLGWLGLILRIEPIRGRSTHLALVYYYCGFFSYILAPEGAKVGDKIKSGTEIWHPHIAETDDPQLDLFYVDIRQPGMSLPLRTVPLGTPIFNIAVNDWYKKNAGGLISRAAGCYGKILTRDFLSNSTSEGYALVKLPSGLCKYIPLSCRASLGIASNKTWKAIALRKAGRNRGRGRRPHVRGVAMNPIDHPHGGGEGKSSGGRKTSLTPWGKLTKGGKTRKNFRKKREALLLGRIKEKIRISRVQGRLEKYADILQMKKY